MSLKQNIENYLTEHIIDNVVDIVKTCSYNGCCVTVAEHEAEALATEILTLIQNENDERVNVAIEHINKSLQIIKDEMGYTALLEKEEVIEDYEQIKQTLKGVG